MTYDPESNELLRLVKRQRAIDYTCAIGFCVCAPVIWYVAVAYRAGVLF